MTHCIMFTVHFKQQRLCRNLWIKKTRRRRLAQRNLLLVDSKSVTSQVQEIQVILHEIQSERMTLQVAAIIAKLPSGWKYFKNYLKHKQKEMNMEKLIVRLRMEVENRGFDLKQRQKGKKVKSSLGTKGGVTKMNY